MAGEAEQGDQDPHYASAVEVDGLCRTLDDFMKKQDEKNDILTTLLKKQDQKGDALATALEKLTQSVDVLGGHLGFGGIEDKGSNFKGKNNQASVNPNATRVHKSMHIGQTSQMAQQYYYSPPPVRHAHFEPYHGEQDQWSIHGQEDEFDYEAEVQHYVDVEQEEQQWDQIYEQPYQLAPFQSTTNPRYVHPNAHLSKQT